MKRMALAVLVAACSGSPGTTDGAGSADAPISASCMEAESHSDLTWIATNVFAKQCTFSGCHNGAPTDAGKMDLRVGHAHDSLVGSGSAATGVPSHMCPTAMRVIPSNSAGSWIEKMLGAEMDTTPPSCPIDPKIGLMPMDNMSQLLCQQKLDAIKRWIDAGALDN
jgi:hypothetical protein